MFDLVTEEHFDLEKTKEYDLSIQLSLDGFSFCIHSIPHKQVVVHKITPVRINNIELVAYHLKEWLESEELLRRAFRKVHILHFSENFTLVPANLVSENYLSQISFPVFKNNDDVSERIGSLQEQDFSVIFSFPDSLKKVLDDFFNEYEIINPVQLIINNLPECNKDYKLVVFYGKRRIYLLIANKEKILLVNNFIINHRNDLVYYVLNTLKQLSISSADTTLFLAESLVKEKDVENALFPYFEDTSYLNSANNIENFGTLKQSIHYYFS